MRMVLEDEEDQGVATKMSGMKERKQQERQRRKDFNPVQLCVPACLLQTPARTPV